MRIQLQEKGDEPIASFTAQSGEIEFHVILSSCGDLLEVCRRRLSNNTAAFIHDLPAEAISNAAGASNYIRVQVLTPVGVLDRDKQFGVVKELTEIVIEAAGDPSCVERTWVLVTESPEGGWGIAGHANTDADDRLPAPTSARALTTATAYCPGEQQRDHRVEPGSHAGLGRCRQQALGRCADEVWAAAPARSCNCSRRFHPLGVFDEDRTSWTWWPGSGGAPKAFRGFDVAVVAAMTERDVDRLVQDASIIRNRGKIQATVDNARAMMSASPTLAELAKSYETTHKRAPRSIADLPTSTPQAEAFAKQLKSQGYRSWGRRACTRSCRTSAWSTTTSTGASARPTSLTPAGAVDSRAAQFAIARLGSPRATS